MSDTHSTVTTPPPAPAAPPAPAPQVDVPVNESPVTTQTPLGNQAPPKPEGQESNKASAVSRREAIQQAFDRSKKEQDEAAKNIAKKPAQTAQKPEPAKPQQHREAGKFARDPSKIANNEPNTLNIGQPTQQTGQQPQQTGQQPQQPQIRPLDENAPYREPPRRFSEPARAEWNATPESVRGAVDKMARDFQGAYEKFRGDYEVMETLRPYHELAQKQGTSLEKAFTNYYQMEQKLHSDVVGGLDIIVQNLRLKGPNGEPITIRDVAHHIMNMSPEQHRLTVQQNQQSAADMRLGQLHQIVEKLATNFEQLQFQQRVKDTRAQVDEFAEKHPRFDELGPQIKQELDLGFPLEVAYQRADRLNPPSNTAAQTRNTSAQTRRTSISGAPDGGNGKAANTRPSDGQRPSSGNGQYPSRREAIAKAMKSVSNGI